LSAETDPITGHRSFHLVAMDRDWRGGNMGKRSFEDFSGAAGRRRDLDLRDRLDRE
jgi:hypothetical protein